MLVAAGLGLAAVGRAGESRPPNILFVIADDWSLHAGAYGTRWIHTPNFDRVARDGILFNNAYTPNSKCAPSRAAILTGRNSWQLKEAGNHFSFFPLEFKTWAEALIEHGWTVGYTAKGWGPGVAKTADGQPRLMTGQAFNARQAPPPTDRHRHLRLRRQLRGLPRRRPARKPWAFWYGAIEPHRGYEFGSGVKKGGKKLADIERVPAFWPDNETIRSRPARLRLRDRALRHPPRPHARRPRKTRPPRQHARHRHLRSRHALPPRQRQRVSIFQPRALRRHVARRHRRPQPRRRRLHQLHRPRPHLPRGRPAPVGQERPRRISRPQPHRYFPLDRSGQVNPARDHVLVGMERHDIGRPGDVGYPIRGIVKAGTLYLENFEPSRWPACNPETGYLNVDAAPPSPTSSTPTAPTAADPHWALCFGRRPAVEFYDLTD
jgi:N-sulfoglucosamine sulfohydrolase